MLRFDDAGRRTAKGSLVLYDSGLFFADLDQDGFVSNVPCMQDGADAFEAFMDRRRQVAVGI